MALYWLLLVVPPLGALLAESSMGRRINWGSTPTYAKPHGCRRVYYIEFLDRALQLNFTEGTMSSGVPAYGLWSMVYGLWHVESVVGAFRRWGFNQRRTHPPAVAGAPERSARLDDATVVCADVSGMAGRYPQYTVIPRSKATRQSRGSWIATLLSR